MIPYLDRNRRTLGETRCSGPLAAPYPYVLFSDMGDQTDYFRMMLTSGFCGLLWQPEIRRASNNTYAEYYARVQMTVLSPALTFNNYMIPYPAWFQMDSKKTKPASLTPTPTSPRAWPSSARSSTTASHGPHPLPLRRL